MSETQKPRWQQFEVDMTPAWKPISERLAQEATQREEASKAEAQRVAAEAEAQRVAAEAAAIEAAKAK